MSTGDCTVSLIIPVCDEQDAIDPFIGTLDVDAPPPPLPQLVYDSKA